MEYFRKIRDYVLGEVMHCCEGIANGRREADVLHHWSVVAILVRCNIAKVSRAGLVIRSRQPTDKQTLETCSRSASGYLAAGRQAGNSTAAATNKAKRLLRRRGCGINRGATARTRRPTGRD